MYTSILCEALKESRHHHCSIEMTVPKGHDSKLFQPLKIANGKIQLKHRVIFAPLTRNRGTPLKPESTPENPNRIWYPDDVMVEYYRQRTTDGGLLISEGIPPSLEVLLPLLRSVQHHHR